MSTSAVLADLAALGPAFALSTGPVDAAAVPLARLVAEPALLRDRVAHGRERLGTGEDRVAASWLHGAWTARLVAPVLGAAALHGVLLLLAEGDLRWRGPEHGGWWTDGPRVVASPRPDEVAREVLGPLGALVDALRAVTGVSEPLLWGEVVATVVKVGRVVERTDPARCEAVRDLVGGLLAVRPLAGVQGGPPEHRRRTCCLAYRVPGGHTCRDCPLGAYRAGADVRRGRRAP
ncbi:(2Fe-2S)-binding protein [Actinomycetospora chiangmaiensis]|uniref:(2Fe-2S)-binding protein n=1 Tax=Actinomycetospora chiangmaiensis TaxID=402650 RepID=UPI0003A5A9BF|nr:(2Fe-2S)-binding protein [Actinomycetospora chiangmaiensis]